MQRAGDRVRVTVQLIDAAHGRARLGGNYDRELTAANIFAIQSEVATAIAAALKATLTADEKTRLSAIPTENLEAWGGLPARQAADGEAHERRDSTEAEEVFRKAIDIDPAFALAYSGLADALRLQVEYSGEPSEAPLAEADRAASGRWNSIRTWAEALGLARQRRLEPRSATGRTPSGSCDGPSSSTRTIRSAHAMDEARVAG